MTLNSWWKDTNTNLTLQADPRGTEIEKSLPSFGNDDMPQCFCFFFTPLQGKKRKLKTSITDRVTLDLLIVFTRLEEKSSKLFDSDLDQTQLK